MLYQSIIADNAVDVELVDYLGAHNIGNVIHIVPYLNSLMI